MKVENINPVKKIEKRDVRKNSKNFSLELEHENPTKSASIISNVNELFSIYTIEENLENQKEHAKNYGEKLLNMLKELKLSLIIGKYSKSELLSITQILTSRDHYQDYMLNDIIDEIELRVKVELAKISL